jgi:hypothetical protein
MDFGTLGGKLKPAGAVTSGLGELGPGRRSVGTLTQRRVRREAAQMEEPRFRAAATEMLLYVQKRRRL